MDKVVVFPGAVPLDTNILQPQRNAEIALGFALRAAFGTSTVCDGLTCAATGPASLSVVVSPGSIIFNTTVDTLVTGYGSLTVNNTDPLVKIGVNLTSTTLGPMSAPGTAGQSQNYLIQASFSEIDGTPVVLPYYNAANPSVPYSGPANSGAAQNTNRSQTVNLQIKAGTPATTGSQTTPAADTGNVGLWVITIANGQSTITSGNISRLAGAPFVDPLLLARGVQPGRLINVRTIVASGTYTPTAGTASIFVRLVGGGGGGGGAVVTGASQCAGGAGGGAGGFAQKLITSAFSGVTMTVGAAGTVAGGGSGGAGGTTSFGGLLSATGGAGGSAGAAASNTTLNMVGQGLGGIGSSGDINASGGHGSPAFYAVSPLSGMGGASFYGGGAIYASGTSSGNAASSPGSGGSGGCLQANSGTSATGGIGASGRIEIWEYS